MTPASDTARDAEHCYELGMATFPEIRWERDAFARAFAAASEMGGLPATADEFVRLSCLADRPGALAVLERVYIAALRPSIARVCASDEATDAVMQDVRTKLLLPPSRKLASYRPTGSFRAWLRVLAVRTALDDARRRGVAQREVELGDRLESYATGPEEHLLTEEMRMVIRDALRAAVKQLPEEQRQALKMHVVAGWNIGQIGRVLHVHRATVARWLVASKERLGELLRSELAERMRSSRHDADHVLESLPARLDLSLSRVIATTCVHASA
jgi:RNA polymerase sigma-70 factor, ECF subfamily